MTSPLPQRPATPRRLAGDGARFLPGQILADRYRMIGLLGKGGMGEVYRADDLKLGQPVALKFLPRDVEGNPERLDRFLNEVKLSLRVTHPNVCRVFDVGDVQGRHFISMEFVDGEDLASLLRRIGRLPEDKAIEVARQLCAGLAAAHEEGVLHRDLKPANVMIDGRGRAKITDFGLAGATAGISGREARVGTPQYMAPEQFDGRELTVQTDLYSLGLVLYELFTGKRAFDGGDVLDLALKRTSTPTSPAAHVSGLSPIVERAIMRCVQPDPAQRPSSASSLAASLPGGDPLAMAMAAGETPSPEMVARSGGRGELRPAIAIACLVTVLAGLGLLWIVEDRTALHNVVPLPKPPEELRVIARNALVAAGYPEAPGGVAFGFTRDSDYFTHVERTDQSPTRFHNLAAVTPPPVRFWYREWQQPMAPFANIGQLEISNPPLTAPGMTRVQLDPAGRLQELRVVPPDLPETPGPFAEPDWAPLFAAGGLVRNEWAPVDPLWTPPHASDVRRAWMKGTLRLEVAALGGRPVWFRLIPEWRRPAEVVNRPTTSQSASAWFVQIIQALIVIAGALVARRNLRADRGDRRGALRLAAASFVLGLGYHVLMLPGAASSSLLLLGRNLALELFSAALVWVFYLAIEPYVRRWWPDTLVAWTRVLNGQLRDPMVGRHLLVGAVAGMTLTVILLIPPLAARLGSVPEPAPTDGLPSLASTAARLAGLFWMVQHSFLIPFGLLILVLVCRVVFRRTWLAYLMVVAVTLVPVLFAGVDRINVVVPLLGVPVILLVLARFGLFAFLVTTVFSSWGHVALTANPSSWFFGASVATMALFVAIAIYGFVVSLGGQRVFKDAI
jgi:serine/threonine-protein kinase